MKQGVDSENPGAARDRAFRQLPGLRRTRRHARSGPGYGAHAWPSTTRSDRSPGPRSAIDQRGALATHTRPGFAFHARRRTMRSAIAMSAQSGPHGSSTVLVSRLRGWLGTLSLLRRRRLTLHLFLRVLRRGCGVTGGAVHRAGRRMLIGTRTGGSIRRRTAYRGSRTCILRVCGTAGVTGPGQRGAGTQDENGTRRENESFHGHLLLLGFPLLDCAHHAPDTQATDTCGACSTTGGPNVATSEPRR
jgi:hypothetical protein